MIVLFDMQERVYDLKQVADAGFFVSAGGSPPVLTFERVEDVKTIRISARSHNESGLGVDLSVIPGLKAGDRITVTGRLDDEYLNGQWGIALLVCASLTFHSESLQLAQQIAPKKLFSLSFVLDEINLTQVIILQSTKWGAFDPLMDIILDTVLITRKEETPLDVIDPRSLVYSLESDQSIHWTNDPVSFVASEFLVRSGTPTLDLVTQSGARVLHVNGRYNDWDGVDINLDILKLLPGNSYEITVTGSVDGEVPEVSGAAVMVQGMPGYSWRGVQPMNSNAGFTIKYSLLPAEVAQWKTIRVTTNQEGAGVPFFIYSIKIKKVG